MYIHSVHIPKEFTSHVFTTGLFVVKNARRGGEDNDTKPTSGEKQVDPRLDLGVLDIEPR